MEAATMSLKDFAKKMGISSSLAYKLAASGQIPTIKLGKRRLVVPLWVLDKMLQEYRDLD